MTCNKRMYHKLVIMSYLFHFVKNPLLSFQFGKSNISIWISFNQLVQVWRKAISNFAAIFNYVYILIREQSQSLSYM